MRFVMIGRLEQMIVRTMYNLSPIRFFLFFLAFRFRGRYSGLAACLDHLLRCFRPISACGDPRIGDFIRYNTSLLKSIQDMSVLI